jgi:hypothetical protein
MSASAMRVTSTGMVLRCILSCRGQRNYPRRHGGVCSWTIENNALDRDTTIVIVGNKEVTEDLLASL